MLFLSTTYFKQISDGDPAPFLPAPSKKGPAPTHDSLEPFVIILNLLCLIFVVVSLTLFLFFIALAIVVALY